MKNRSRCLLLLVLSILICSVNIALADEIGKNFSHRIPIYNLSTGTTVYETKLAVHPYVSYSVLHKDQKIDGKYYTVYYDAKNPDISVSFGPIGDFASYSVDKSLFMKGYDSSLYRLTVSVTSYKVNYDYFSKGTKNSQNEYIYDNIKSTSGYNSSSKTYDKKLKKK